MLEANTTALSKEFKVMYTEIWCVCSSCYNMFVSDHWKCSRIINQTNIF